MTVTISAEERDALYDFLLDRLSGIGDVALAKRRGDHETARRLGREYADDLRLLDGLGLGPGKGENVSLRTPPEVLRRALPRLGEQAHRHNAGHESERAELDQLRTRNRLMEKACRDVLVELGEG
jgi:hypothetical protein